ncbi:porin family protein [Bernardetia sp. OM2101]|uniref:porin family protein n=1 Tax=Bernardetia sp. OM2101 TaxID=3344876 RepID=UPI0035D0CBD1
MVYSTHKNNYKALSVNYLSQKTFSLIILLFVGIFINLFSTSYAFCQSESTDSTQINSSIPLDSVLLAKKIKTKFSIGFRGGITNGQFEISNPEENDKNSPSTGSVLTFFTNYRLNSHFSIQPELVIGRYRSNNTSYRIALLEGTVDYTISTFDVNLIGIYSYQITDWFSLSAEAGVSAARLYNSFGKVLAPNPRVEVLNYDVNSDNQFEKLNYGAIVGITPSFNLKNVSIQTSVRYRYGLNNINSFDYRLNRYLANPERTIQTRDLLFQVGFFIPIYRRAKLKESVISAKTTF